MFCAAKKEMLAPCAPLMVGSDEQIFSLAAGVAVAFAFETHTSENTVSGKKPHQGIFSKNRTIAVGATSLKCQKTHWDSGTWWPETVLGPTIYGYDGHGSVRQLTNSSGAVTDSYEYDAFGNLSNSTGSTPNNYLFAGEQYDPALNLYYNRARYLNTTTGRFWSMDTAEGNNRDPLSLHKYLYAEGNPVDHVDPSGHEIDEVLFAVAVAVVVLTLSTPANTPIVINQLTYNTVLQEPNIWEINWKLTRASTRGGWIVQHIVADFTGVGHYEYWEAWPIPANSNVPSLHGVDEYGVSYSDRFGGPAGSQIDGNASFYEGLTLPSSFTIQPQGFPAGILRATTSDPNLPTGNATFP